VDGGLMDFKEINGKLENALEIIMEHFSETEDRITELEDEVSRLTNELKKLANNDELGNPVAHFFKSGNVLRKADDRGLIGLKSFLPKS
jgi:uncharacterized small protein (DUF1192 family)